MKLEKRRTLLRSLVIGGALLIAFAFPASRLRAATGLCPPIIDEPLPNQVTGTAINLRAHGDPACTNAMIAYIDGVQCTPSPPGKCFVNGGSDFSPYPNWVGVSPGSHTLVVNGWDAAGNVSVSDPTPFTVGGPPPPPPSNDPVIAGAGDIANLNFPQGETATLLSNINPTYVVTFGDNVYGTLEENQGSFDGYMNYYDPSWGVPSLKSRTLPTPGNHDFGNLNGTAGGIDRINSGYIAYFTGNNPSSTTPAVTTGGTTWDTLHYGVDITTSTGARWRYISIDTGPCLPDRTGGTTYCDINGPEYSWLQGELAAHKKTPAGPYVGIVAVTHFNRYDSEACGGGNGFLDPYIELLYDNRVDLILDGHVHNYEDFGQIGRDPGPTNQAGCAAATGPVRDFGGPVLINVGTGGYGGTDGFGVGGYDATVSRQTTIGVIAVTLHDTGFDFAFYSPTSWPTPLDSGSFGLR